MSERKKGGTDMDVGQLATAAGVQQTAGMTDIKHHGPLFNERSRRHQMTADSNSREDKQGILTIYEVAETVRGDRQPRDPRLHVEVMVDGFTNTLKLTVDEARELAGAAAEFVRCWQGPPDA